MPAYILLVVAVLSRLLVATGHHAEWYNFTAVGGALLFFGARRSWREMVAPLAVLMATDYFLTTQIYSYPFAWSSYLPTWMWYVAAMALGQILLKSRTSVVRAGSAALLGPTSFFLISNFAVWIDGGLYPRTMSGLGACYVAGLPFYRNDVASTTIVVAAAFGVPVLVRKMNEMRTTAALAAK